MQWDKIVDYKDLYDLVKNYKYIFVDEIQNIKLWEKAINSLLNNWHDVYITWSNSTLLSGDLATNLRWRYIKINVYPLDYNEFILFHKLKSGKESFDRYIKIWSMPYLVNLPYDESIVNQYLEAIWETIIFRDVVERFSVRNVSIFNPLVLYIANNIWTIFSGKSISNFLNSQKFSISNTTILSYLGFLKQALIINEAKRYKIKWKKIFEIKQKYYFTDWWIRNSLVWWYKKLDISQILENIVFMNLLSKWWDLKVWEIWWKEVDFVCEKDGEIMYLQIAYLLESEETKQREFSSLLEIKDSWPKYVLSMDEWASWSISWIKWVNIWEFLIK